VTAPILAVAGMRWHVHSGDHAAESFVSFIPLSGDTASRLDPTFSLPQRPSSGTTRKPERSPADPAAPLHPDQHVIAIAVGSQKSDGDAISTPRPDIDNILSVHPAL
jgi:hypothetical protein